MASEALIGHFREKILFKKKDLLKMVEIARFQKRKKLFENRR